MNQISDFDKGRKIGNKIGDNIKYFIAVVILFIAFKMYYGIKTEIKKNEIIENYYGGDTESFNNDLENSYGGDFERMKNNYENILLKPNK
jgi:hypothetical protein